MSSFTPTALCVTILVALCAGCQQNGRPHPTTRPAPHPGDRALKKVMLQHIKANRPPRPERATDKPTKIAHPGIWPFKNKRVVYVYHDRLPKPPHSGFYAALLSEAYHPQYETKLLRSEAASDEAEEGIEPGPATMPAAPEPDIVIYQGWIYVNGDNPRVGTKAVVAQAVGTAVLVYFYPTIDGDRQRICCLEGDPSAGVWVYNRNGSEEIYVPPGFFVDVLTSRDHFVEWITVAGEQVRPIEDLTGDSWHNDIMEAVESGQHTYEVS